MSCNNCDTALFSRKIFCAPQFAPKPICFSVTMETSNHHRTNDPPPTAIVPWAHTSNNTQQRTCGDHHEGKQLSESQLNRAHPSTNTDINTTANQRDQIVFRMLIPLSVMTTVVPRVTRNLVHAVISSKHEHNKPKVITGGHLTQIVMTCLYTC